MNTGAHVNMYDCSQKISSSKAEADNAARLRFRVEGELSRLSL
jgi:hypothetical protein